MKRIILLLCLLSCGFGISAQHIKLIFPALPEKSARVYYYNGNRLDSLSVVLDKQGKGETWLPANYKGFIQVAVFDAGAIECVAGEPVLKIECNEKTISKDNTRFPDSKENQFFYRLFEEKSLNINRKTWIQVGLQLYKPENDWYRTLENEDKQLQKQLSAIDAQIRESDLYASKLLRIIDFISDIQMATNTNVSGISTDSLKTYFHTKMDWNALHTSGRFWRYVQEDYIRLFDQPSELPQKEKEIQYVENISPLFEQLREPLRSDLLETIYTVCEQMGWETAKGHILSYIFDNHIILDSRNENLKRILATEKTMPGKPAPEIAGLSNDRIKGLGIVLFYESGCDNCVTQLEELKKHYARLNNTGIQVISIAADTDQRVFEYHSKSFPWPDKLCDYKGFLGENFINYAILGTPTLYVIGNGIIIGRYASLSETGLLK